MKGRIAGKGPSEGSGGKEICKTDVVLMRVWIGTRSYVAAWSVELKNGN